MKKTVLIVAVLALVSATTYGAFDWWKLDPAKDNATDNTVQMLVDVVSESVSYIGRAKSGTLATESRWQIFKKSVNGTVTTVQFYSGDASFNAVWNDRTTATYK